MFSFLKLFRQESVETRKRNLARIPAQWTIINREHYESLKHALELDETVDDWTVGPVMESIATETLNNTLHININNLLSEGKEDTIKILDFWKEGLAEEENIVAFISEKERAALYTYINYCFIRSQNEDSDYHLLTDVEDNLKELLEITNSTILRDEDIAMIHKTNLPLHRSSS